jgi:hypothetical protein
MLSQDQIDKIFDRCDDIHIQLDENPIRRGPNYLNKMVAKCRNRTTEVQKYKRAIIQEKLRIERKLNKKETEKEIRFNDLMSNDERVTKRSSKSDREAKANDILQDLNSEIKDLESELTDIKHVESFVESKLRELRDVNRDIRLQKRLIEDEIDTGSMWGEDNTDDGKDIDKAEEDFDMSEILGEDEPDGDSLEETLGDGEEDDDEDYDVYLEGMDVDAENEEPAKETVSADNNGDSDDSMTFPSKDGEVDMDELF